MLARSPREAMNIGKSIKTTDKWCETTGVAIMEKALNAKYEPVPTLTKCLHEHNGKQILRAQETLYGELGTHYHIKKCQLPKTGWGKTLLGNIVQYQQIANLNSWKHVLLGDDTTRSDHVNTMYSCLNYGHGV